MTLLVELGDDFIWVVLLFLVIALSPAIIMTIIGFAIRRNKPKAAKVLFIVSAVYAIVGLGVCGALLS